MTDLLDTLNSRRSTPSRQLAAPGPDAATLEKLLGAAIRVPDHGKLAPWRMIVLQGDAKLAFGEKLAALKLRKNPDLPESKQLKERQRYTFAPLVIAVVNCAQEDSKIPVQEQLLSTGCLAYNLLLGAQALGFGAQWLTGWAAYDPDAGDILGLQEHERVVGFVHVGTPQMDVPERDRPRLDDHVSTWAP